jgi:hypothetical protein
MIGERSDVGLVATELRRESPAHLAEARIKGAAASKAGAAIFAASVMPVVRALQASGINTTRSIAESLNSLGVRTARGGIWHRSTVTNLLARDLAT